MCYYPTINLKLSSLSDSLLVAGDVFINNAEFVCVFWGSLTATLGYLSCTFNTRTSNSRLYTYKVYASSIHVQPFTSLTRQFP